MEKEGEKHSCVVASHEPPTGHLACNSGMCLDGDLNQQPSGSQAGTQSTEPHQPGPQSSILNGMLSASEKTLSRAGLLGMPDGRRAGRRCSSVWKTV